METTCLTQHHHIVSILGVEVTHGPLSDILSKRTKRPVLILLCRRSSYLHFLVSKVHTVVQLEDGENEDNCFQTVTQNTKLLESPNFRYG